MHRRVCHGGKRVEGSAMFADEDGQPVVLVIVFLPAVSAVATFRDTTHVNRDLSSVARRVDAPERQSRRQPKRCDESGEKISRLYKRIAQLRWTGLLASARIRTAAALEPWTAPAWRAPSLRPTISRSPFTISVHEFFFAPLSDVPRVSDACAASTCFFCAPLSDGISLRTFAPQLSHLLPLTTVSSCLQLGQSRG